jgi:hypothetical protein
MSGDHYISRVLTKPWEDETRRLHYFDFSDLTFGDDASKSLFTVEGQWSRSIEDYFDKSFETHLEYLRQTWDDKKTVIELPWQKHKAWIFLFIAHIARLAEIYTTPGAVTELEKLLQKYEDQLAQAWLQKWELCRMKVLGPLFFPETAHFAFPVKDQSGHPGWASVIPIGLNDVLMHLPLGTDKGFVQSLAKTQAFISCSVGMGPFAKKVVLYPEIRRKNSEETLRTQFTSIRKTNEDFRAAIEGYTTWLQGLVGE